MRPDSPRWVEVTPSQFAHERAGLLAVRDLLPDADSNDAVLGLKFSDVLPPWLARQTVALRLAEPVAAAQVIGERRVWHLADVPR